MENKRRPIDANALMEYTQNQISRSIDCNDIARFPTMDAVEVVHGRWKERYTRNGKYVAWSGFYCSVCGKQAGKSNYCPNCGARMDGDENA